MNTYQQNYRKLAATVFTVIAMFSVLVSPTTADAYSFYRDMTVGSTGTDVAELQTFLVERGFLVMPVGVSKGYFGELTRSALGRYQASVGISPTAGYFGPITRAHINAIPVGPVTPPNDDDDDDDDNGGLSGGDGDFSNFDILGSPDNEDVEENQTVEVLGFEFDAEDSDLRVERVDVLFAELAGDTRPWRVFDEVSLVDDEGDEIVSQDASEEDAWSEEEEDQYSIRFDDVDFVVDEDDTARMYVAVTTQDSLDDDEMDEWTVQLMEDGVRAMNAEGIDVYEGDSDEEIDGDSEEREFTLEEAQAGEFDISVDENDNEDMEVEVSEDDTTDEVVLYTASVESDEGDNMIEEVTVDIATTSGTAASLADMIRTLYLFIDGDEVGSESVAGAGTDSVTFDDIDFDLSEGDEVSIEVLADIDEQEGNYANGAGVYVSGISLDYVDENDDDLTESETTDGGDITFSVDALNVDYVSDTSDSPVAGNEALGRYTVTFKVTAPDEEDIYIAKGATTSTSVASGQGAEFIVIDGNGNVVNDATVTSSNSLLTRVSGGSETGNYYKISQGNTAELKLDVIVDNTGAASSRTLGIQLTGINYKAGSAAVADVQFTAGLDEDFRSDTEFLLTSNVAN